MKSFLLSGLATIALLISCDDATAQLSQEEQLRLTALLDVQVRLQSIGIELNGTLRIELTQLQARQARNRDFAVWCMSDGGGGASIAVFPEYRRAANFIQLLKSRGAFDGPSGFDYVMNTPEPTNDGKFKVTWRMRERVLVGRYETRADAEAMRDRLRARNIPNAWVEP